MPVASEAFWICLTAALIMLMGKNSSLRLTCHPLVDPRSVHPKYSGSIDQSPVEVARADWGRNSCCGVPLERAHVLFERVHVLLERAHILLQKVRAAARSIGGSHNCDIATAPGLRESSRMYRHRFGGKDHEPMQHEGAGQETQASTSG